MAAQISASNQRKWSLTHLRSRLSRWRKRCFGGLAVTAGGALMVLGSAGSLPAIALTDEEFGRRLESVPVFTILREDGRPVVVFPNRSNNNSPPNPEDARILSFLDPDNVEEFMERIRQENSEEAGNVSIFISSIGDVYQWGVDNPDGPKIEYYPIADQIPEALRIVREANPDRNIQRFPGVPLFVATNSDGNGYLTLEQDGRKVVPFFFRLEDLNSVLEQFRSSSDASILDDVKVEVATLDQILDILRSSDASQGDLVERIRLIPSGEALEYVRGLRESSENAQEEAERPTEGAGALVP
ncbi:MAG: Tic22 family protein [Cyanophyceae cyanobacterium]